MKNLTKLLLLCLTLILPACRNNAGEINIKPVNNDPTLVSSVDNKSIDDKRVISATQIGQAKLGMTLGELKKAASEMEFKLEPSFMVDISAISAMKAGEVQYYILFVSNQNPSDNDIILNLMTKNPQYQTKEGVKVGMEVKEAEELYGNAVLSYNINNESREYVEFNDADATKNISFRPNSIEYKGLAGIYPEKVEEYNQTESYRDDAEIAIIEVACAPIDCPEFY